MSEKNDAVEDVVDVPEITPSTDDQGNDTTDWKAIAEANRELALKNQGIAKRFKTKFDKSKEVKPNATPVENKEPNAGEEPAKSNEFDYGQKAFLRSYDIKGADEIALAKTWMNRTGDALDVMVEDEIFQAKLKNLREAKTAAEAIPKGRNRANPAPQNNEEYWTAKIATGEAKLSDITDVEVRRKVLNKRIETEKSGSKFSKQGIVRT